MINTACIWAAKHVMKHCFGVGTCREYMPQASILRFLAARPESRTCQGSSAVSMSQTANTGKVDNNKSRKYYHSVMGESSRNRIVIMCMCCCCCCCCTRILCTGTCDAAACPAITTQNSITCMRRLLAEPVTLIQRQSAVTAAAKQGSEYLFLVEARGWGPLAAQS